MTDLKYILISITGRDKPGITSALTKVFATHGISIQDIEQVTNGGNLNLSFLVNLNSSDMREHPLFKDFIFKAWELGVHVDFRQIEDSIHIHTNPTRLYSLTLLGEGISAVALASIADILAENNVNIEKIHKLSGRNLTCIEMILSAPESASLFHVKQVLLPKGREHHIDLALQKESVYRRAKRLIVLDMDSTLIQGEVIDELAACYNVKDKVSYITDRAMQGELNFAESLKERVSLLKGLHLDCLEKVRNNIKITPGGYDLIKVLKRLGYKIAVISGGFSYFSNWLKDVLQLDYAYANELEIKDSVLTGGLIGPIVDGVRKADLLEMIAKLESISLDQVIAVGDGANDINMLKRAGLGVAFNAKKSLKDAAEHAIDGQKLDAILYLLGIRDYELDELLL